MSSKSVLKECQVRSVLQECQVRSVLQECQVKVSSKKGVLQECHLSVSRQGVPQVGSLENVISYKYCFCSSIYVSAFGFVGFILFHQILGAPGKTSCWQTRTRRSRSNHVPIPTGAENLKIEKNSFFN